MEERVEMQGDTQAVLNVVRVAIARGVLGDRTSPAVMDLMMVSYSACILVVTAVSADARNSCIVAVSCSSTQDTPALTQTVSLSALSTALRRVAHCEIFREAKSSSEATPVGSP